MKVIHKSYKFKLEPTEEQKILLNKHLGSIRFIYNHFLNERKEQYQQNKKSDNYYKQAKTLTELKKNEDTIWLNEINSQSLQYSLRCLDTAYLNFFKKKAQFPRFKSKKNRNSFTIPQFADLIDNKIYIPKFKEGIKVILHREIKGKVGKMTISKTPTNKYYVSILTEEEYEPIKKSNKSIGVDLGLKTFIVTSDNTKFKNNKYFKKYEKQLAKAQRHLSRKVKGSNSYERQRRKVAKIHEKISNSRQDNLHKISHKLISEYDIICLENLAVKNMIKNRKLSKHISDASWGTFIRFLEYKAEWNDKTIIKIGRFYPSSKTCHECGYIKQHLDLKIREWVCPDCNVKHDRDYNAAINILNEGLRNKSVGIADYTDGDDVRRDSNITQLSTKSETISKLKS